MTTERTIYLYITRPEGALLADDRDFLLYRQSQNFWYEAPDHAPRHKVVRTFGHLSMEERMALSQLPPEQRIRPGPYTVGERIAVAPLGNDAAHSFHEQGWVIESVSIIPEEVYQGAMHQFEQEINASEEERQKIRRRGDRIRNKVYRIEQEKLAAIPRPKLDLSALLLRR